MWFPLADVIFTMDAIPSHGAFYFEEYRLPLLFSETWLGSVGDAHITIQVLLAVVLRLCGMAFHLYGKVDALHLDNSTTKANLCNQGGTVYLFSFQPSLLHIESGQQAHYYSYSTTHTYPFECAGQLYIMGKISLRIVSSSLHSLSAT